MTSSSSLYSTVTQQNVSSTNSTSLYGEAGTPIPDSSGNLVVRGDLTVLSGNILTTAQTGNIFPANATTINLGLAATTMNIGAGTGTTTVNNNLVVSGDLTVDGTFIVPSAEFGNITVGVVDDNTISTTSGDLKLDSATNLVIVSANEYVSGYLAVDGDITTTNIQGATAGTGSGTGLNLYSNNAEHALHLYDDYVQISSGITPGWDWIFNPDGTTDFPNYKFPALDGSANQVLATDGSGLLAWTSVQSLDTNYTIDASTTTGGANFNLQGSDSTTDTVKFANGTGITISATDANTITITNSGVLDPYNIDASATTGGANLNLTNGATTDTVKFASSGATTVSRTDANTITIDSTNTTYTIDAATATGGANINLLGSDSSTDTIKLASGTGIVVAQTNTGQITITNSAPADPYNLDATATTGGANLNLNNASGTDTVKFADGGHITATRTTDSIITLGSDATSANTASAIVARDGSGNFSASGATLGNVTVGVATDQTVTTTSGDLVLDSASGVISALGQIVSTRAGSATTGAGQIYLNGSTSNRIDWSTAGIGAPAFTTRSSGTKAVLYPALGASAVDYALGVEAGALWSSIPGNDAGQFFKWYGGTTQVASLSGTGDFSANGATLGNITIGVATDNTITTTSGDLVLDSFTDNTVVDSKLYVQSDVTVNNGTVKTNSGNVVLFNTTATTVDAFQAATAITMAAATGTTTIRNKGVITLGAQLNAVTAGVDTTNTISTTAGNLTLQTAAGVNSGALLIVAGANGNIFVTPNGTGNVAVQFNNGGNLTNTRNYVAGAIRNATTQSIGDIWAVNSTGPVQPFRGISLDNSVDTSKNAGYVARNYSNTAGNRSRLIFERARGTAASPTAVQAADLLGDINATGYTSTGWINDNIAAVVPGALNFVAAENWVSNTNLGTQMNVSLAPTATTISSAANLVTVMGINPQTAAFRSDSTTFSQGKSGTTTYATLALTGNTLTALNANNFLIRQGTANTTVPAVNVRYQRTDTTGPNDGDGVDYRMSVAGTSTNASTTRIDTQYRTSGLHDFGIAVSTDSFTANASQIVRANAESFKIRAVPAGGGGAGTATDIGTFTQLNTTINSDAVTLQTNAGVALIGSKVSYNRVYGQWQYNTTVTPAASNTAYVFPLGTADFNNIASVGSTSRLIPGAAGMYKTQFSLQVENSDNGTEHTAYIWWRKNGVDVPASMGRITVPKAGSIIAGWDNMVSSANTTDYWELAYATDDATHISFPAYAATAFGPTTASLFMTLVPVGV